MSIPDKAVEAATQAYMDVRFEGAGFIPTAKSSEGMRAALEAAEPYLTGGLRQELKDLREYCAKYVDDPDATEAEQLAYDDVCISIAQILQRHPEVES